MAHHLSHVRSDSGVRGAAYAKRGVGCVCRAVELDDPGVGTCTTPAFTGSRGREPRLAVGLRFSNGLSAPFKPQLTVSCPNLSDTPKLQSAFLHASPGVVNRTLRCDPPGIGSNDDPTCPQQPVWKRSGRKGDGRGTHRTHLGPASGSHSRSQSLSPGAGLFVRRVS
jgi:hypothetical protein